jgi:endonuclease G, mitochondrial
MELEEDIRERISQDDTRNREVNNVWVIAGPIFDKAPVDRWPKGIAVPTHCYMIVAYKRGYRDTLKGTAYIFPQQPAENSTIEDHVVSIREIESRTGINFFPDFTPAVQNNLETVKRDIDLNKL